MIKFTKKELEDALEKSSQVVQDEILGPELTSKVRAVIKQFNFDTEEEGKVMDIITYITLDLLSLINFIPTLKKEIGLNEEMASLVAEKVDNIIFADIRKKIKIQNEIEDNEDIENKKLSEVLLENIEKEAEVKGADEEGGESFDDIYDKNKTKTIEKSVDSYRELI